MFTKHPSPKKMPCSPKATMWSLCGNVNGKVSRRKTRPCVYSSSLSNWCPGYDREMPSAGDAPMPSNFITWSSTGKSSVTSTSALSTPEPTKTVSTQSDIPSSSSPPKVRTFPLTLDRSNAKSYPPTDCTIQPKPLTERSHVCRQTDSERCLVGTWCTPELQEAIIQGYVIQCVYEVWHFPHKSNQLFSSYVNIFLKITQEASGWPDWVGDDDDKRRQYLNDYRIKEGISLEADKIDKNPGRRSLAKMMLNSFWGKYGQQGNKSQVEGISELHRLYHLLDDDSRELQTLRIMNDEMIEVIH